MGGHVARSGRLRHSGGIQTHNDLEHAKKADTELSVHSKATGRFFTKCGAILDIQTAAALQDEMESLDGNLSTILQDEDVQRPLVKKMIELGIK